METWKSIPDFPGYEVSDRGLVRSVDREVYQPRWGVNMSVKGRVLAPGLSKGYQIVRLSNSGKATTRSVHSLVLSTFHRPRKTGEEVRHLDGNRANNRLSNLAWGTKSDNTNDQVAHGTHRNSRKTACPRGHELVEPNLVKASLIKGQRVCRTCAIASGSRNPNWDDIYDRVMSGRIQSKGVCRRGHRKIGPNEYVVTTRPDNKICLSCKTAVAEKASNVQLRADEIYLELMEGFNFE